jgi:hypothetical protein
MSTRRLAAILAADMVGYSHLMGANEETMPPERFHVMRSCRDRPCTSSAIAAAVNPLRALSRSMECVLVRRRRRRRNAAPISLPAARSAAPGGY